MASLWHVAQRPDCLGQMAGFEKVLSAGQVYRGWYRVSSPCAIRGWRKVLVECNDDQTSVIQVPGRCTR